MINPTTELSEGIEVFRAALEHGVDIGDYDMLRRMRDSRGLAVTPRGYQRRALAVGFILAVIIALMRVGIEYMHLSSPVSEPVARVIDTLTSALSSPVVNLTHPTVGALLDAVIKALETALVFGGLVGIIFNVLQQRIARQNLYGQLTSLLNEYDEKRSAGELPVRPKEPYIATHYINNESTFENAVGEAFGWGIRSLPYCETDDNPSSSRLWIKLPDNNLNKNAYFEAFSRGHLEDALAFVFFPQADEHIFLPDPSDTNLFHIGLAGFIERVGFIDEYLESKGRPLIPIMIVADELMSHSVSLFSEHKSTILEVVTLKQEVANMNKSRPESAQIHIIDATNVALESIATPTYNPHNYPLSFVSDPAIIETHGTRFIQKIHKLSEHGVSIKHTHEAAASDKTLMVGYHIEDIVATAQIASITPEDCVVITHYAAETAIVKNFPVIELDQLIVMRLKQILDITV